MSWFRSAGGEKVKYTTQYDKMTKQPVGRLVIKLGIPTTLSMLVTNIYNMVDTMFVGKLGTSASGAVGIVFGFMSILQAFGFLFGQGAGSIISRRLGNKDEDRLLFIFGASQTRYNDGRTPKNKFSFTTKIKL